MDGFQPVDTADALSNLDIVTGVWERVLRQPGIAADSDFFDLGGDSLLALQIFTELERITGAKLPITLIYDAPTPEMLAVRIAGAEASTSPLLVHFGGQYGPPIFIIHGIGGNIMDVRGLAKTLSDGGRRVYGIQAQGLDGMNEPLSSIDSMADTYVSAIQELDPTGPYHLIGYSFGGFVAIEMARRLRALGKAAPTVFMIEAYPHPSAWPKTTKLDVRVRRAIHRAQSLLRMPRAEVLQYLKNRLAGKRQPKGLRAPARSFAFDESWPEAIRRVFDAATVALINYRPRPYDGRVIFYRGRKRTFFLPGDPRPMWKHAAPQMVVEYVTGEHESMVTGDAADLARRISGEITAVETAYTQR